MEVVSTWNVSEVRTVDGEYMVVVRDLETRLREPVMLRYNAEQVNAERKEAADVIKRLRNQLGKSQEAIEDAVDTLEAMNLHVDNPLYDRLRTALESASHPDDPQIPDDQRATEDMTLAANVRRAAIKECEIAARGPIYKQKFNGHDGHNWSRDSDYGQGRHAAADAVLRLLP